MKELKTTIIGTEITEKDVLQFMALDTNERKVTNKYKDWVTK